MSAGIIKSFDSARGYGFIQPDNRHAPSADDSGHQGEHHARAEPFVRLEVWH